MRPNNGAFIGGSVNHFERLRKKLCSVLFHTVAQFPGIAVCSGIATERGSRNGATAEYLSTKLAPK